MRDWWGDIHRTVVTQWWQESITFRINFFFSGVSDGSAVSLLLQDMHTCSATWVECAARVATAQQICFLYLKGKGLIWNFFLTFPAKQFHYITPECYVWILAYVKDLYSSLWFTGIFVPAGCPTDVPSVQIHSQTLDFYRSQWGARSNETTQHKLLNRASCYVLERIIILNWHQISS